MKITQEPWGQIPEFSEVIKLNFKSDVDGREDWSLVWHNSSPETWLVAIHGHGSLGDQIFVRPDVRDLRLPEYRKLGLNLLAPNTRGNGWMGPAVVDDLHAQIEFVRSEFGAKRFLFLAGSMGGTSNLIYAVRHPEDISLLVALCPATDIGSYHEWCCTDSRPIIAEIRDAIEKSYGGTPEQKPDLYRAHSAVENCEKLTMPIYLAHGSADALIPCSHSRNLVNAMSENADITYTEIPDGGHDAPICEPKMMEWLEARLGKGGTLY